MHIITGARRAGKTWELVQRMKKDPNGILFVHNYMAMLDTIEIYGIPEQRIHVLNPEPIPALLGLRGTSYVDNLDLLLYNVLHLPISTVTATGTSEQLVQPHMRMDVGL